MRIFLVYLCMEFKRSIKVLQKTILVTIAGILLLLAGIAIINFQQQRSQTLELVEVGVVIPEDEWQTKMVAQFISAMDSAQSICHFNYLDEEQAFEQLRENLVQAVIVFPEGFYEDVDQGQNTPATIYFSEEADLNVSLFGELLTDGVAMLQSAEAGVYAILDVTKIDPPAMKRGEIGNFVAQQYIEAVLGRGQLFEKTISSPYGVVDFQQYYFAVFLLLVLFLYSLNMSFLYKKQSRAVAEKMRIYGLNNVNLSLVRILVIALQLWIVASAVYLLGYLLSEVLEIYLLNLDAGVLLGLFLLCCVMATYVNAVFVFAGSNTQGTAILLVTHIIMILGAGILVPAAYLPEIIGKIAGFMPAAGWNEYCRVLLFEGAQSEDLAILAMWIGLWGGIGVVGLWKNMRSGMDSC